MDGSIRSSGWLNTVTSKRWCNYRKVITPIKDVRKMILTSQTQVTAPQKQVTPQYRCCHVTSEVPYFSVIWTPGRFIIQSLRLMPVDTEPDRSRGVQEVVWMKLTKYILIIKMPDRVMTEFSGERELGENEMWRSLWCYFTSQGTAPWISERSTIFFAASEQDDSTISNRIKSLGCQFDSRTRVWVLVLELRSYVREFLPRRLTKATEKPENQE
jgi:hypothetical protein